MAINSAVKLVFFLLHPAQQKRLETPEILKTPNPYKKKILSCGSRIFKIALNYVGMFQQIFS